MPTGYRTFTRCSSLACFLAVVSFAARTAADEAPARPDTYGKNGVAAGAQQWVAEASLKILDQGGNAVDAGVAGVFAASVVEIREFGFGGEAPTMIYDAKTKEVLVVDGQGPAPKAMSPDLFKAKGTIDPNGPLAGTIPAVVDAMALALETKGTMRLEQVMQPAIDLADGFPCPPRLHEALADDDTKKAACQWESSCKTYWPDGKAPEVGGMFRQPNLAKTMRAIVAAEKATWSKTHDRKKAIQAGRDAFYKGAIAHAIADADKAAGGVLAYDDLAGYHGQIEKPLTVNFKGYDVYKPTTWSQGPVLLQMLQILDGVDLKSMGLNSADYLHTLDETIKLAFDDRDAYYGDPAVASVPIAGLLSKDYAAQRRALIGAQASLEHRPGDPYPFDPSVKPPATRYVPHGRTPPPPSPSPSPTAKSGDTTTVAVVDKAGNMFTAVPSSGWMYGGVFIAGDTGVPLGNHLQSFDLDPASPNVLAGGKRPRTTLSPTIVLKDGKPFLAVSVFGGDAQDQQALQLLVNTIVFGMGVQEALDAPHVNSLSPFSSFAMHASQPGLLQVESGIPAPVRDALTAKGHKLKVIDPNSIVCGTVAVGVDAAGTLRGGADPRHDRVVIGW